MGKKGKKICICETHIPFVSGGAELLVRSLNRELTERGFDVEIVRIPFKWYPKFQIVDSALAWKLIDLTESDGIPIDLLICTKFPSYITDHPNKVIWLVHQFRGAYDLAFKNSMHSLDGSREARETRKIIFNLDDNSLKKSKKIYTISKNVSDRLLSYNGIASKHLYHPPSLVGQYKSGCFGDYILSVGRLDELKRIDLLIGALPFIDKKIHLKIAGKGYEYKNLVEIATKLKVIDRVEFLGFVDDKTLIKLYSQALGVYFAPLDEDYGYITLEAFLSKKPVITTDDSGGVLEFVEDGYNGCVSEPDPEKIGKNINYLYHKKERAEEFGKCGFENIKDISWDNVVENLTMTL